MFASVSKFPPARLNCTDVLFLARANKDIQDNLWCAWSIFPVNFCRQHFEFSCPSLSSVCEDIKCICGYSYALSLKFFVNVFGVRVKMFLRPSKVHLRIGTTPEYSSIKVRVMPFIHHASFLAAAEPYVRGTTQKIYKKKLCRCIRGNAPLITGWTRVLTEIHQTWISKHKLMLCWLYRTLQPAVCSQLCATSSACCCVACGGQAPHQLHTAARCVKPVVCSRLCAASRVCRAVCIAHYESRRFDLGFIDASGFFAIFN